MRYFAYITPQCEADAKTRGFATEIAKLAKKVEADQSIDAWDKWLPSPFVKKNLGSFRLVAENRIYGDDIVVCFRVLMARGDARYKETWQTPENIGGAPSDADIVGWLAERKTEPAVVVPEPTEAEYRYLFETARQDYGEVVYETPEWVERTSALPPAAFSWLFQLLADQVLASTATGVTRVVRDSAAIVFRRYPELNRTLLIAPLFGRSAAAEAEQLVAQYARLDQSAPVTDAELRRESRRAYPALVAAEAELWLAIENDAAANLALSPEELHVLDSVSHDPTAGRLYPLFINGRPGSGKSTILQYLFAEHLTLHLARPRSDRSASPPIYLTYSEKLLEVARRTVRAIISSNAGLQLLGHDLALADIDAALGRSFALFHQFVLEQLAPDEARRFAPGSRVTFSEFRKLWRRKAVTNTRTRGLSAELAWHVLRTYIKGMRDDVGNYCDPDVYAELPAKRRTVSQATFELIFHEVWSGWYGALCASEGLWDDQDLTRAALDSAVDLARFPVVFCDEAQDFTRIELELILRLALFSRRRLSPDNLKRVPIAFAGDPFQTLNPTGFQWSSVQAGFHEQIVQELDPLGRARLEFNFQELSFNYRSGRGIVLFCNLIQALRGVLFDIGTLSPQQVYFEDDTSLPSVFRAEDPAVIRHLAENEELVIVLPCQEGGEQEYISADEQLKVLAASGLARNFLSSAAAKGLEFSRVVLYKFGEDYVTNHPTLLRPLQTGEAHRDSEMSLPLIYFINRLYVGASRAKRRLFIVDTDAAISQLWQHASLKDPSALVRALPHSRDNGWSAEHLAGTQPGAYESWSQDRDDPRQLASQFEAQGDAASDPYLLRLAEANYKRAQLNELALRCAAKRLEIEGDFRGAGDTYVQVGRPDDALRCFWSGRHWDAILALPSASRTLEGKAARFMAAKPTPDVSRAFLEFLFQESQTERRHRILADRQWAEVCSKLVDTLGREVSSLAEPQVVYGQLRYLAGLGLQPRRTNALAELAFAAGEFGEAVAIWDAQPSSPHSDERYQRARAETAEYPDSIEWLARLGRNEAIAGLVREHRTIALPSARAREAVTALVALREYEEALEIAQGVEKPYSQIETVFRAALAVRAPRETVKRIGLTLIRSAVRAGHWQVCTEIPARVEATDPLRELFNRELVLQLATSEPLTHAGKERDAVAMYLRGLSLTWTSWDTTFVGALGAAIERAGRIVDALAYYEDIWRTHRIVPLGEERDVARREALRAEKRWCKCKYRQAEFSKSRGKPAEANQQKAEADSRLLHLGIKVEELPEYPKVDAAEPRVQSAAVPEKIALMIRTLADSDQGFGASEIASALGLSVEAVRSVVEASEARASTDAVSPGGTSI